MIEVEGLTVVLGGQPVLREVSLSVAPGQLTALVGPSGSGKTVLLKALCGLLPAAAGSVRIDGEEVVGRGEAELFEVRRRVGMLFQAGALFDDAAVLHNVAFPLLRRGVAEAEALERARTELGRVGLAHAEALFPHELSGGMRKRVGIARALVAGPAVALFDEPTAGLDPVSSARIMRLVAGARDAHGAAALAVGNELEALLPAADEALVLFDGRVAFRGPPAGLPASDDPRVRQFVAGGLEGPL